jgi:hypothetical protein
MSSGGTGVPRKPTLRNPDILVCSMEVWPWQAPCRSRSPVLPPSADSSSGWCCTTCVGWLTDLRDSDFHALRCAPSTTKLRNPSPTYCLVAFWQEKCGMRVSVGEIGRIGCPRKGFCSMIGFSPGVGGSLTLGTSGPGWP